MSSNEKIALLIIDHGSRLDEANQMLENVCAEVRKQLPDLYVAAAHMELANPDIAQGFAACVEAGASTVIVHPYMLAPGKHATEDIPRMVHEIAANYQGINVKMTGPLGVAPEIAQVILKRAGLVD